MAQIESGGGGKKVSVELNLVPFIDLMSVLITFLLLTAVWTQISLIQIGSSLYSKQTEQTAVIPPKADVVLKLDIYPTGYTLTAEKQVIQIPLLDAQFNHLALIEELKKFKEKHPEKVDGAIAMADELPYENLIRGMDAMLAGGFTAISVLTGGPK